MKEIHIFCREVSIIQKAQLIYGTKMEKLSTQEKGVNTLVNSDFQRKSVNHRLTDSYPKHKIRRPPLNGNQT
jgi:hypothetical protein